MGDNGIDTQTQIASVLLIQANILGLQYRLEGLTVKVSSMLYVSDCRVSLMDFKHQCKNEVYKKFCHVLQ